MNIPYHIFIAFASVIVIWFLSGILIDATDRVAKRYHKPGFFVAFFVLGFLTSISEISVMVNATIGGVPSVSAGNLIGASFVIFLLLIPLLAIVGNGVSTHPILRKRNLFLLLQVVVIPSVFALDGLLTRTEGLICIFLYSLIVYAVHKRAPLEEITSQTIANVHHELLPKRKATITDSVKILIGALSIFFAGKLLVDEALFFSQFLQVPPSFIGLLLLSIGTNIPEISIALRCVLGKHKNIAFGDYMGSAAANTPLLGILILLNGDFAVENSEFIPTFLLMFPGVILFYIFSFSKEKLSRKEGTILLLFYIAFVIIQIVNIIRIAPQTHGAAPLLGSI